MENALNLNEVELKMFREISNVLQKYDGKTRKFGLQLIHSHFPLKSEEILHETHDKERRKMLIQPILKNLIPSKAFATAWTLNPSGNPSAVMFCCDDDDPGSA